MVRLIETRCVTSSESNANGLPVEEATERRTGSVAATALLPAHLSLSVPTVQVIPVIGQDQLVLDPAVFERTTSFLPPEIAASYLETLAKNSEALLHALREPGALSGSTYDLAEAAHTLGGSASLFGFKRLAVLTRSFERAVQSNLREMPSLADGLCGALEASVRAIRSGCQVEA
jgi:HPt (histidine-containing phosphotransfer) domain-containing protein